MWIIGRKSDQEVIHQQHNVPDISLEQMQGFIVENFGGDIQDYSFYSLTKKEFKRASKRHEYEISWENDDITGLDFNIEDAKLIISCETTETKNNIDSDGVETFALHFYVFEPDGVTPRQDFTRKLRLPIETPKGLRFTKLSFENGEVQVLFKTTEPGEWAFPGEIGPNRKYKIGSRVKVTALLLGIF